MRACVAGVVVGLGMAGVVLAGCFGGDQHCRVNNRYGDLLDNGCLALEVSAGHTGGFDTIEVFASALPFQHSPAVLTPELLAGHEPAPQAFVVVIQNAAPPVRTLGQVTQHYAHDDWVDIVSWTDFLAVVGYRDGVQVGAAVTEPPLRTNDDGTQYFDGAITLSSATAAEVWGNPVVTPGGTSAHCLRLVAPDGVTCYATRQRDRDCDGVEDDVDCLPDSFCDPLAGLCICPRSPNPR